MRQRGRAQREQSCPRNLNFGHGQAVMDKNKVWRRGRDGAAGRGERGGGRRLILAVAISGRVW